ncbi:hypothetical protein MKX01_006167 [Papaver californicum]|nr:hypothetical protein MKX01_006167 [Papaver californicum]
MPPISAPPSQFHPPSLSRSPLLLETPIHQATSLSTTPGSPVRKIIKLTKLEIHPDDPDNWLPLTESRNGNAYYAAFHILSSGIGIQALVLPVAFTILGRTWGIISLTIAFLWQLYTLWLHVQLHESVDGTRYSRYLDLFTAASGTRARKILATAPIVYLSAGTCIALIIIGGSTMKLIYQTLCAGTCSNPKPLTPAEWYLVFTCVAVVFSQLPSLNSIAGVSLIAAVTAVGYCTIMWVVSVIKSRIPGVTYDPVDESSDVSKIFGELNAPGIIAFAFRGHNLVLEIQGTLPSSEKYPSKVPIWRGVKLAYAIIAMCLFPLAIGGYWAYGHMIPENGSMLSALFALHSRDTSKTLLVSTVTRLFFGFINFFAAVAIPFLGSLAGLIGGLALPITLVYAIWYVNWGLGILGIALTCILVVAGLFTV